MHLKVGRNPCKLPSDVEKVNCKLSVNSKCVLRRLITVVFEVVAIDCDRLRKYRDVIVFSIADYRSPASRLSGGEWNRNTVLFN